MSDERVEGKEKKEHGKAEEKIGKEFDDKGREKVIQYVVDKYGRERVAQIVTIGTMAAKSAVKDVARTLKVPLQEANRLTKMIPFNAKDLADAIDKSK